MRLHRWLLVVLGLIALVAASLPLWPPGLGLHAPSAVEATGLAALGVGCLLMARYFTRRDQRNLAARQADAAAQQALTSALVTSGVIADFAESTRVECLRLAASPDNGTADAFASRLGGVFYSPPGFAWPLTTDLRPMWPLAQLNFAELPHLGGFPDHGILQFFITGDDLYGMDLDDQTRQSGFRVVYHPEVGGLTFPNPAQPDPDQLTVPFEGSFRLAAKMGTMPMTVSDWRFKEAIDNSWRRRVGSEPGPEVAYAAYEMVLDAEADADAAAESDEPSGGHQMGGYAYFTQEDPRGYAEHLQGHTTVLLQIDSAGGVCWGDVGVASFLIEPERLSRCDFTNVLYTWDCH